MRKKLAVWTLLAAVGGYASPAVHAGKFMTQAFNPLPDGARVGASYVSGVPNMVGPYGQPVEAVAPAVLREPTGADYARAAIMKTYPNELLQAGRLPEGTGAVVNANYTPPDALASGSGIQPAQFMSPQPGGPGPGGLPPGQPGLVPPGPPGAVAALGALTGQQAPNGAARTEVRFVGPAGMKISWYAPRADGRPGFSTQYLEAPARYNFLQSSVYRLKLSDIPNRPGVDLYPTLEVPPCTMKTSTFLAHSSVPLSFTEEDFEQVAAGNFVVKVIYLPDPQFQDLAATGPDEVVSSRLEPGADPILEAKRRGSILAIIRLGNIDLEAPNTPAMDSPDTNMVRAYQLQQQQQMAAMQQMAMMRQRMMAGMMPGMMPPGMPNPGAAGQPGMAGMMQPGVMQPGMMPPGMMPPGMQPGMAQPGLARPTGPGVMTPGMYPGMYPGMPNNGMPTAPTVPTAPPGGTPTAPTVPTPLIPGTNPATSPLGRLFGTGNVVPAGATSQANGR